MQAQISPDDILKRLRAENPWWDGNSIGAPYKAYTPRPYFKVFFPLVRNRSVRRAVVLMGPRRVGKTVMIYHGVQQLVNEGIASKSICYFSVDHPIYNGLALEKFLQFYGLCCGVDYKSAEIYAFFDEIQYLREWEVHLKVAVDTYPNVKFVVSGSAAAALRMKSQESGAGRFTNFLLPPLTFYEYLTLLRQTGLFTEVPKPQPHIGSSFSAENIEKANQHFLQYLNFGGYPELIESPAIQADPARFIKSDIIDKVLLRDLPSLYGIGDIQELNYLFTTLAFNTGNEISLGEISKNSGVAKNTMKRYIEYLEAAFLIRVVHRVDHTAKRFRRANFFKVYLTNPSMRAALFAPLKNVDDDAMPSVVETAAFSQWFHSDANLHYARWQDGEVDIAYLGPDQKLSWAVEVKWSDRYCENPTELKSLIRFCRVNKLKDVLVTSRTRSLSCETEGIKITFVPASVYCYTVGFNAIYHRTMAGAMAEAQGSQ